jgi:predicted nucleotide-binding protein
MADVFHDGIEALKARVEASGIVGAWSEEAGGKHVFRSRERGILNHWPATGRVNFQGPEAAQGPLKAIFAAAAPATFTAPAPAAPPPQPAANTAPRTKIFIVHGHDTVAMEQLELILRRLNLNPFILQNNDGGGNTIIEALEQRIYNEAAFGIVLMTPDDFGYPKAAGVDNTQPRARQNVVLEMGMLFAALGRNRMAVLKKGNLEIPSDIGGLLRLDFNDHVKEVAVRLATRMKQAGIEIDDGLIAGCGA